MDDALPISRSAQARSLSYYFTYSQGQGFTRPHHEGLETPQEVHKNRKTQGLNFLHKIKTFKQTIKDMRAPEEKGLPRHNKHFKCYKSYRPRLHHVDRSTLHTCGQLRCKCGHTVRAMHANYVWP